MSPDRMFKWLKSPNLFINACAILVALGMLSYDAGYAFGYPTFFRIGFWLCVPMLVLVAICIFIVLRLVLRQLRRR